jgi:DNA-binding CsgD family transcriptional regulator
MKFEILITREQEIAKLEITANFDISERTDKAHLSSVYEKTKTGSRLNLALLINRG